MVVVSYSGKEINAKLVYYGAGLSGKTTNLESIYEAVPETSRGKMVSMKTQSDRTLFFDLLPLDLGEIMGFKTRFLLYTVPGQVFYNATRKLVLKGADAIVFVADSEAGKMDENRESLANLRANLAEYGLKLEDIPWVIQYNKRDLPEIYSVQELNAELNPDGKVPAFEAVATQGTGVFETFRGISHLLMERVTGELRRAPLSAGRTPKSGEFPRAVPQRAEPVTPVPAPAPALAPAPAPAPAPAVASRAETVPAAEAELPFSFGRQLTLGPDAPVAEPGAGARTSLQPETIPAARAGPDGARSGGKAPGGFEGRPPLSSDRLETVSPERPTSSPERPGVGGPAIRSKEPMEAGAFGSAARPNEVVVPIVLPRGTTREIVLRIVISEGP